MFEGLLDQLGHTKGCMGLLVRKRLFQCPSEFHNNGAYTAILQLPIHSRRNLWTVVWRARVWLSSDHQSWVFLLSSLISLIIFFYWCFSWNFECLQIWERKSIWTLLSGGWLWLQFHASHSICARKENNWIHPANRNRRENADKSSQRYNILSVQNFLFLFLF